MGTFLIHKLFATGEHTYDSIPDQISGIFFGWAKLEAYGVSKAVVSIGWDLSVRNAERAMVGILSSDYLMSCLFCTLLDG